MTQENQQLFILGNEAALDADGWALIAPYGEWPKSRVASVDGRAVEQKFLQVLDNDSADRLLDKGNSLFGKLRRALVGISVWKGHPDLRDHAPETLENAVPRVKLGAIDKIRKSDRGIEAHFVLDNDGATAVKKGFKYPSALWLVLPNGEIKDGAQVCHPFKLLSVGLTDRPNISGVESLANARGAETQNEPPMKLIAGWLLANGVALANTEAPTEIEVLNGLKSILASKAGEVTTLANEKTTSAGKITALENEKAKLSEQVTTLTNDKTAMASRATALENSFKTERKARSEAVVDLAITKGKVKVADRAAKIEALSNAVDDAAFKTTADGLLKGASVAKTIAGDNAVSGKVLGNDGVGEESDPRDEYATAMADHLKLNPGCGPIQAHNAVMKKFPTLADKLKARGESQTGN